MCVLWRKVIQTLAIVAVLVSATVVGVFTTQAATVTSANDYPSTLQTSQAANHRTLFTTPSGVAEGSTIILTFASEFDTSSLTEDDVDVADDGVDLTTAANCSSTEQASVTIASDVITITICAGDGGAMAATSVVTIEIGTNATSSGTGTNRITNPSSTGNYYVSISGTFGDSGSIILPIGGDDSIAVSATVTGSSGGGGGGGGGGGAAADTTPPVISNIVVSGITTSEATITWTTDEATISSVTYWTSDSAGTTTVSGTAYFTSHSFTLTGLSEGETYLFTVTSTDFDRNSSTSSTQTFTTLDETAPVISDIEVVDITTTSARVTWTTDEPADSTVSYGLTTTYAQTESDESLVTSHSILLTDLAPGMTYHFQALSTDASSNQGFSSDQTFTTDEDDPPANVSNLAIEEGDGELVLTWTNPTDADLAGILVLRCEDGYPTGPSDSSCVEVSSSLTTSLTLAGLTNGVTYYFGIFAYDEAGQFASGALVAGTPKAPEEEVPSEQPPGEEEGEEPIPPSAPEEVEPPSEAPPTGVVVSCGDGVCSESESSVSCPLDCGVPEEPTTLGPGAAIVSDIDIIYLVADESLTLEATRAGVVDVLPTSTVRVAIQSSDISADARSIYLSVGSTMYLMRLDEDTALYFADLTIAEEEAILEVVVLVTYQDGSEQSVSSYLRVVAPGYVYQLSDGEEVPVSFAQVTLFEVMDGEESVWDGSPYAQFNPTNVALDGTFSWYVPNGSYQVSASAEGFEPALSGRLTVTNSIVNPRMLLTAKGLEGLEGRVGLVGLEGLGEAIQAIRELPGVEVTANLSTATLAVMAGAGLVTLALTFNLLPFLQYIFSAPILFFWRRRRKGYGVVYNAISKTPVDLAVVRLFQLTAQDEMTGGRGRLVKSRVTDRAGRYFFLVSPGRYRIHVSKPGFEFPSDYLKREKTDGAFLDVYHAEVIEVKGWNTVITANIPLDPSQAEKYQAPSAVKRYAILRALQHGVALIGVIASMIVAFIRPTPFSFVMVAVQIGVYLLVQRLAVARKPTSWGIVYDKETGRPLSQVIARIFEPKYHKLLETQLTDSKGRYAFLLGPNQYYAVFEKTGFKKASVEPIDYSHVKEAREFAQNVPLESDDLASKHKI